MDARRSDLAAIHCARRDLALDETAYRALLERVTGKTSAGELSAGERKEVLAELGRLGWSRKPGRRAGRAALPDSPQARKIRALWLTLHQEGVVRNPSEASLDRWVLRMSGVHSLRFVDVPLAGRLIETLKAWLERGRAKRSAGSAGAG
jgi:phage gp16-like protein